MVTDSQVTRPACARSLDGVNLGRAGARKPRAASKREPGAGFPAPPGVLAAMPSASVAATVANDRCTQASGSSPGREAGRALPGCAVSALAPRGLGVNTVGVRDGKRHRSRRTPVRYSLTAALLFIFACCAFYSGTCSCRCGVGGLRWGDSHKITRPPTDGRGDRHTGRQDAPNEETHRAGTVARQAATADPTRGRPDGTTLNQKPARDERQWPVSPWRQSSRISPRIAT
jgi:hypothetical protein